MLSKGATAGTLHTGTSYCKRFLLKRGTAQSSIVSSVVSFNVLTAHTLFLICLATSSMDLLFSEQSLEFEVSNFESILTELDVKSNILL